MRRPRSLPGLLAAALAAAALGCGGGDGESGFGAGVERARVAQAASAVAGALVALSVVRAESGGASAAELAAALGARDPSARYTTAPPGGAGTVQVLGGGAAPVMLLTVSEAAGGRHVHVAAWQGEGTTRYYAGAAAPAYTAEPPAGPGWAGTLPR